MLLNKVWQPHNYKSIELQICNISGPVFQIVQRTLQNLILDYNCFTSIPTEAIRGLDNLIGLHLKYNNVRHSIFTKNFQMKEF